MQQVYELINQVAGSQSNLLIEGESGTGKELVARAVHFNSTRASYPFVAINCSALPETLLESELFGYVKGAFTDAKTTKKGLFEVADAGTLFLDESSACRSACRRRSFARSRMGKSGRSDTPEPKGGCQDHCRDQQGSGKGDRRRPVQGGSFLPPQCHPHHAAPLRERREDIPLLAQHFLTHYARLNTKKITGFDSAAMSYLMNAQWRGNVRELENAIERAVVLCKGETITTGELVPMGRTAKRGSSISVEPSSPSRRWRRSTSRKCSNRSGETRSGLRKSWGSAPARSTGAPIKRKRNCCRAPSGNRRDTEAPSLRQNTVAFLRVPRVFAVVPMGSIRTLP